MKPCPDITEIVGAEGLPDDHPLRLHLAECARCRASLKAYRAFLADETGDDVTDDELDRAGERLTAFIDGRLPGAGEPRRARGAGDLRRWLPMAAVLVAAVGIWAVGPRLTNPGDGDVMRGDTVGATAETVTVTAIAGNEVMLRWTPMAGADDYVVILWTAALEEFARLEPVTATGQRVAWDVTAVPGPTHLTVVARQGGREIERSELISLP